MLTLLLAALTMAGAPPRTPPMNQEDRQNAPRFTVVPPGPVSDRARVELRLAVPNDTREARTCTVRFYWDRAVPANRIAEKTVTLAPQKLGFVNAWTPTAKRAGKRRLIYQAEVGGRTHEGAWPMEVIASETPAPPFFTGVWLESFAAIRHCQGATKEETERNLRDSVDAMNRFGMKTIVVTYVEYLGTFFYPSSLEFYDRDAQRVARGSECPLDVVGIVMSQAEKNGMHVILGLGRGGDTYLLWQFEKADWKQRNEEALDLARRVAQELWTRFGHSRALYGWYLTHEMNDLAKSSAYYDPLADFCHSLSPDKPVLVAPAGTPILTPEILKKSRVDIFAYQDAVGAGYVPYKYTYKPENRIAMLEDIFAKYRAWHAETEKHLWADLEVWEMDGSKGYGGPYPAIFSRVKRQIAAEAKYVEALTAYAWHGYFHAPESKVPAHDPRATSLFEAYFEYLKRRMQGTGNRE